MLSIAENKLLNTESEVIQLTLIDGKLARKPKVRYNKDGSIDKRQNHKQAGVSSEVYGFTSDEEIKAIIKVLDKHIDEADREQQRQIAHRNKMMFLIGINVGVRASDLVALKWSFFFEEKTKEIKTTDVHATIRWKKWKREYKFQPKKTKKTKKFVTLYFNQAVKKAVTDYIEKYPIEDIDGYLFKSRKGDESISERSLWRIIKEVAAEAGIEKNIGSHSLRKTFGYWTWHNAKDKNKALVTLQYAFNHSSTQTTMKYIGLLNSEIEELFYSIDLGLDYI